MRAVRADGTQEWRLEDRQLHRDDGQPARVWATGRLEWWVHGQLHRDGDQPAVIGSDGHTQLWYLRGQLHRDGDQPAVIYPTGTQEWWRNGRLHRDGDQPARVWVTGRQEWYLNGQQHRDGDQPAIIGADGSQWWIVHNTHHRRGGKPAVIQTDGLQQWWVYNYLAVSKQVTDFREGSLRFVLVQAVVCAGLTACDVQRDAADRAVVGALLAAVQVSLDTPPTYHVTHEYAFLVALFL